MTNGCRLLVCGGRDFADRACLDRALDVVLSGRRLNVLIHGAASGADSMAGTWAVAHGIPILPFPAEWMKNGVLDRGAGFTRNEHMLREGKPDLGIGFPRASGLLGNGTRHMLSLLVAARVPAFLLERGHWRSVNTTTDLDGTKETLVRVVTPHFVAGYVASGGTRKGSTCVEAAPIIRWAIGKSQDWLMAYFAHKGWQVEVVA
jgi:hypothetical protein